MLEELPHNFAKVKKKIITFADTSIKTNKTNTLMKKLIVTLAALAVAFGSALAQDLAAVTCAMLRSQGIPARLVIGQLGSGTPHAWVMAVVDGEDVFFDPTAEKNASNKSDTYTTLRLY